MSRDSLVTGIFNSSQSAAEAVALLVQGGVPRRDISVIAASHARLDAFGIDTATKAAKGAGVGGAAGVAAGALIAGFTVVGAIATGGVGILASGPIVAALAGAGAGAAAGGVIGGLIGWGLPEHHIEFFKNAIEAGSILVGARVSSERATWARRTLEGCGAHDPSTAPAPAFHG